MAERSGGDSIKDNNDAAQPLGRTIWASDDGRQWTEEGNTRLKVKATFLYADNRMVASTNPGWLQTTFDTLTRLFDRVELKKNVRKTVGTVCHPCGAAGVRADQSYNHQMTGEGRSYKEQQWEQVN